MNEGVGSSNNLDNLGGKTRLVRYVQRRISGNVLGEFYRKLSMVINDTCFGEKLIHPLIRSRKFQWTDIFVGRHIY